MNSVSMIAAMTRNRVIGKDNDLPWHLPDDFQYFKEKTRGHHVIMGRKNFESLPEKFKPLPDRTNIIITHDTSYAAEGTITQTNLIKAISLAIENGDNEPFIIGGGEIYKLALPLATRIYLTEIDATIDGDTLFPDFDRSKWKEVSRVHHQADRKHVYSFDFVIYEKK